MKNIDLLRNLIRVLDKNIGALEKLNSFAVVRPSDNVMPFLEIGFAGEISLIDLANLLNLDKSTMSRTVNNLVTDELVERVTDPENRRYVKLMLSKNGQMLNERINSVLDLYFENVMNDIPEDKREQVAESLVLLINALNKNNCC